MLGDLFDSPWKILIVAAVILVLFGSAKLPAAARSLGKSMRILKSEIKDLHGDDDATPPPVVAALPQRQPGDVSGLTEAQPVPVRTQQPG
jgi:sec-independent protein translocase protein TatA